MSKVKFVHCREVSFDCDAVASAETEEELLAKVAEPLKQCTILR